jgi:hypothetical protein
MLKLRVKLTDEELSNWWGDPEVVFQIHDRTISIIGVSKTVEENYTNETVIQMPLRVWEIGSKFLNGELAKMAPE